MGTDCVYPNCPPEQFKEDLNEIKSDLKEIKRNVAGQIATSTKVDKLEKDVAEIFNRLRSIEVGGITKKDMTILIALMGGGFTIVFSLINLFLKLAVK
jgi:hypothetical protein